MYRNWVVGEIERIYVYLYIVYGLFSFVNFSVASPHQPSINFLAEKLFVTISSSCVPDIISFDGENSILTWNCIKIDLRIRLVIEKGHICRAF